MGNGEQEACLDAGEIASFLQDELVSEKQNIASQHLMSCETCRQQLTSLAEQRSLGTQSYSSVVLGEDAAGHVPIPDSVDGVLSPGTTLGRYVVLVKVGAGGMGVVYSAFDPELNRQIAIKVIRTEALQDTERAHANLREEARAMAQLAHPNVVRVYDVGTQGPLVYIAMEYVDGENLREFAKRHQERGDWRPIFDACMQAGRGLQAAHEAGLVHRDFKPSNVLVSKDARVFVADFGLTRLFSKQTDSGSVGWTSASGTPGYAAPEQIAGQAYDVRSDQYSFCVAMAECLYGREPSSMFRRIAVDKRKGTFGLRRLAPLLERGLSKKNEDRHESMQSLLDKLQSRSSSGRKRAIAAVAVTALASTGVLMFVLGARASGTADACAAGAERFGALWNAQRHDALRTVLAATPYEKHSTYFLDTAGKLARGLAEQQHFSCEATYKKKSQSAELFDRQMLCLNTQATELDAVISMVEDGVSVEAGQSALGALPSTDECRVSESLLSTPAPPSDPSSLAKIQSIENKLAQRRALQEYRKPLEALEVVEEAIVEAEALGYSPLITRAEALRAQMLEGLERFPEAREAADRARDAAAKGRDTRRLVIALLRLASIASTHEDNAAEASAFVATARSLSLGVQLPTIDLVNIEVTSGMLAQASGNHDVAMEFADKGLAILGETHDETEEQEILNARAALLQINASAHFAKNELAEAAALLRTIHELKVLRLGPEHSELATSLINIATVEYKLDKHEEALTLLHRARELLQSPDAKRSDLGQAFSIEALVQNRLGNLPEAVTLYEQTIEVYKELFGEDHANIWRTKANLANTLLALQRWDEAIAIQREFMVWTNERYGDKSPTSFAAKLNLASTLVQVHYEDGEVEEAQELLTELMRDLPSGDPTLVAVQLMQGNAFVAAKQYSQGVKAFEQSLALHAITPNLEPSFTATTTTGLANALWLAGSQSRALSVAQEALLHYDKLLPGAASQRAEQVSWIQEKEGELKVNTKVFDRDP
tara:strand:+ start:28772 stop:31786 length:3015 start_codon:yes stop_codon:yes gene_type:complete